MSSTPILNGSEPKKDLPATLNPDLISEEKTISDFSLKIEEARKKNLKTKEEKIETRGRHPKDCRCGNCKASKSAPQPQPAAAAGGDQAHSTAQDPIATAAATLPEAPKELPGPNNELVAIAEPIVATAMNIAGRYIDQSYSIAPEKRLSISKKVAQAFQIAAPAAVAKMDPTTMLVGGLIMEIGEELYNVYQIKQSREVGPVTKQATPAEASTAPQAQPIAPEKINPLEEAKKNQEVDFDAIAAMVG